MKKLIIITTVTTLLSSCGLKFGDYHRYQQVHGNKVTCKVMIDGNKNKSIYNGETITNWSAHQFTN